MTARFDILPGLTPTVVFETGTTFEVVPGGVLTETTSGTITYTLSLATGAYALTGQTATTFVTRKLSAATGSYALTGSAATLIKSYVLAEATGSYTLTGSTLATLTTRKLPAVTGTYTLTGSTASVFVTRKLSGVTGSYFITGSSATPKLTLKLPLATGAYSLTGSTAATFITRKLAATSGSYALTGSTATTVVTRKLAAATGAFALTGSAAQVFVTRKLAATSGVYALTGQNATLTLTATGHYTLAGDTGNYTLSGSSGTLTKVDGSVTTGNIYTVSGPQVVGYLPLQDGVDQVRAVNFPGSTVQRQTTDGTAGPVPAFQSDLTALSALPAQISFSRAWNAMMFDSTGKLTYAPNNFFLQSNTFSDAAWQKSGTASVTAGFADPVGGSSATRLDLPAINDSIGQFINPFPARGIHSVWVRSDTPGTIHLQDGSGGAWNVSISVGTTWTLVDTGPQVQASSLVRVIRESGDLASLYIYNQVLAAVTYEITARTADQVITTSSAYYGPRFDHNPSTLAAKGLLIEEQRTNIIFPSGIVGWNSNNSGAATGAAGTSPDGTNDAVKITSSAGSGTFRGVYASTTGIAIGPSYTFSAFATSNGVQWMTLVQWDGSVNKSVWFDLTNGVVGGADAGSTGTIQNVGNGWYRLTHTRTSASTVLLPGLYPVDANSSTTFTSTGSNGPLVFGGQLEVGSFATSYISTTSAAVTRSADVAQLTGAALTAAASAAVSFFIETDSIKNTVGNQRVLGFNGSSGPGIFISADNTVGTYNNSSVKTSTIGSAGTYSGGIVRSATCGDGSGRSVVANGGTVATDGNVLSTAPITLVYLGSDSITNIDGWIRSLAIYSSRLSDATLQTKSVVGASF